MICKNNNISVSVNKDNTVCFSVGKEAVSIPYNTCFDIYVALSSAAGHCMSVENATTSDRNVMGNISPNTPRHQHPLHNWRVGVLERTVILELDNKVLEMSGQDANTISKWLRIRATEAKKLSHDTSKQYRVFGMLSTA